VPELQGDPAQGCGTGDLHRSAAQAAAGLTTPTIMNFCLILKGLETYNTRLFPVRQICQPGSPGRL
jgi:hypothetical protein